MVAANSPTAMMLPTMDSFGENGLIAINTAVTSSKTPSSDENVFTVKMSYNQLINGLFATSG